jgi:hypothetical protein
MPYDPHLRHVPPGAPRTKSEGEIRAQEAERNRGYGL